MKVTNWGSHPVIEADLRSFQTAEEAKLLAKEWNEFIPRGLGRCYGDSSLSSHIASSLSFNRFLNFDDKSGLLTCQSGVSLAEIIETFVPRGWFIPVTPGTKFVTVGGAIGSDVHGKNHHKEGSFSKHLESILLLIPSGEVIRCSSTENAEIFQATCGGMGLTGLILEASFYLKKIETSWIRQRSIKAKNLEEVFKLIKEYSGYTYSVAWIDTIATGKKLGRSILLLGEHASLDEIKHSKHNAKSLVVPAAGKLSIPFNFPNFTLNRFSIKIFNALFYGKHFGKERNTFINYDKYFYPLDGIHNWNRLYGKRGFTQYQFVLPPDTSYDGIKTVLEFLANNKLGSFLSVLKYFGPQESMISFPMEGFTLTLDFPINDSLFPKLDALDKIVLKYGGRIYLTKDCRMNDQMFRKGYPNAVAFSEIRKKLDPDGKLSSLQSKRIGL